MNFPRFVILAFALLAGLAAAYVAATVMGRPPAGTVAGPPASQTEILVVVRSVPAGVALTGPDMRWIEWPERGLTEGMIRRSEEPNGLQSTVGKIVLQAMLPGEPVRRDKLLDTGGSGLLSTLLPPGRRAYAVSIDEKFSAGGFILPGDRVDVLAVAEMTPRGPGTRTVLQNVKVVAVGHRIDPGGDKIALGRLATVEVSPSEVELLASIERTTPLMLSLRPKTDDGFVTMEYPVGPAIIFTGR